MSPVSGFDENTHRYRSDLSSLNKEESCFATNTSINPNDTGSQWQQRGSDNVLPLLILESGIEWERKRERTLLCLCAVQALDSYAMSLMISGFCILWKFRIFETVIVR